MVATVIQLKVAIKTYEGVEVKLVILTSVLDACEWLGSHPDRFAPGKDNPDIRRIRGWVGPSVSLGASRKE
jgi:hypothetical protein